VKPRCNVNGARSFEVDTEPYAKKRDAEVRAIAKQHGVDVHSAVGHTLHDVDEYLGRNKGEAPKTYQAFCALMAKMPPIPEPIPPPTFDASQRGAVGDDEYCVPTMEELGYSVPSTPSPFRGGETEGLQRLQNYFRDIKRTAEFEKPSTNPYVA
jgi:cryptochrome